MVGANAIGAKDQESAGEHETEHHPRSLITDVVDNRQFKVPLEDLHLTPGIQ